MQFFYLEMVFPRERGLFGTLDCHDDLRKGLML